jgi:hypothetical protein
LPGTENKSRSIQLKKLNMKRVLNITMVKSGDAEASGKQHLLETEESRLSEES